ncbi:hypothetical protein CR201_G0005150 [Pongo abelii]|uniref:Uncharacterized protein n=1 Tax=Pongo abelii TaxID=9601 RepID=A0A2J8X4S0_PONAB|nr:hypothetical protein CR201_G0005150 [Pongo abelii]
MGGLGQKEKRNLYTSFYASSRVWIEAFRPVLLTHFISIAYKASPGPAIPALTTSISFFVRSSCLMSWSQESKGTMFANLSKNSIRAGWRKPQRQPG